MNNHELEIAINDLKNQINHMKRAMEELNKYKIEIHFFHHPCPETNTTYYPTYIPNYYPPTNYTHNYGDPYANQRTMTIS